MTSSFRKMFSTKSSPSKSSKANSTKAFETSSSTSIYSTETVDIEKKKREAFEAQRAKQAEEYLRKNYGVLGIANFRIVA